MEGNQQALQRAGPTAIEPSPEERRVHRARRVVWGLSAVAIAGSMPFLAPWVWAMLVTGLVTTPVLFAIRDLGPGWSDLGEAWKEAENGDLDALEQAYQRIFDTAGNATVRVTALLDLGHVALRKGQLDRALEIFNGVWTHARRKIHKRVCASNLALCHALRGDEASADAWLDRARHVRGVPPTNHAIALARLGRYREVLAIRKGGPPPWRGRINQFHALRTLALMRAFAAHLSGGRAPSERRLHPGAGPVDTVVTQHNAACPAFPGEYDYLTASWPELREFIEAHPWKRVAPRIRSSMPRARLLDLLDKHKAMEAEKERRRKAGDQSPTSDKSRDNI